MRFLIIYIVIEFEYDRNEFIRSYQLYHGINIFIDIDKLIICIGKETITNPIIFLSDA